MIQRILLIFCIFRHFLLYKKVSQFAIIKYMIFLKVYEVFMKIKKAEKNTPPVNSFY